MSLIPLHDSILGNLKVGDVFILARLGDGEYRNCVKTTLSSGHCTDNQINFNFADLKATEYGLIDWVDSRLDQQVASSQEPCTTHAFTTKQLFLSTYRACEKCGEEEK